MTKNEKFSKYLSEKKLDKKYEEQINKARSILIKNNEFAVISIAGQFEICFNVCLIAIQTSRHDLTILSRKQVSENDFKYSIYSKITETDDR